LKEHRWNPAEMQCPRLEAKLERASAKGTTLEELLRRPGIELADMEPLLRLHRMWPGSEEIARAAGIDVRYEGYIEQQKRDAERTKRMAARHIPPDMDYWKVEGLNRETREKLSRMRPRDLAMAARIPGITPAAVSVLNIELGLRQSGRSRSKKG